MRYLSLLLIISLSAAAQPYQVGHISTTIVDASRSNRSISVELYYPANTAGNNVAVASGQFPLVVFGHGFSMNYDAYAYLWNDLVPRGYIMAFPTTEIGPIPFPVHADFGKDMAYAITWMQGQNTTAAATFFGHFSGKSAFGGHSMGGGCSYLAAANNTNVTALFNFAAAETNPSAVTAAASVTVPALVFAGSQDCIAPPGSNQNPMYTALASSCKTEVTITNASHCQFADNNTACGFGELTSCPFNTYVSRGNQHTYTLQLLEPWLDFLLKGQCNRYFDFENLLTTVTTSTYVQSCNVTVPVASITPNGNTHLCGSDSVQLQGAPSGLSYLWSTGSTAMNITASQAGTYQLIATNNYNCSDTASVTVTLPTTALGMQLGHLEVSCNGNNDGTAWATVSGGYGSYLYVWSSGVSTDTTNLLSPGIYLASAIDSNGCVVRDSVTITEPPFLNIALGKQDATCNGTINGRAWVNATGGNSNYSYLWSNSTTIDTLNAIGGGTYSVTVTDARNCAAIDSITVFEPTSFVLKMGHNDLRCNDDGSGKGWAGVQGGTPPFQFTWDNTATTDTLHQLQTGTYVVTVTDSNQCTKTDSIILSQPSPIVSNIRVTTASCPGVDNGGAHLSVNGGVAPYTFDWSRGFPIAIGDTVFGLSAGTIVCTITDANGCIRVDTATITALTPVRPNVVSYRSNGFCLGDTADIATDGTYSTYQWNTGDTAHLFFTVQAGDYSATVTDSNGCTIVSDTLHLVMYTPYQHPVLTLSGDTLFSSIPQVQWYYNDTFQLQNHGAFTYPVQTGIYQVFASDTNGCVTSTIDTITLTGIAATSTEPSLRIYPNPVTDILYIDAPDNITNIMLLDVQGKTVATPIKNIGTHQQINLHYLPAGSYWFWYERNGAKQAVKLIHL